MLNVGNLGHYVIRYNKLHLMKLCLHMLRGQVVNTQSTPNLIRGLTESLATVVITSDKRSFLKIIIPALLKEKWGVL